jgi:hypothetical protein
VYLGAEPIVAALKQGAHIVVSGRVADPSIFMAPMMHEFDWDPLDHPLLGQGNGIGHLMECGAQVTEAILPTRVSRTSRSPGISLSPSRKQSPMAVSC